MATSTVQQLQLAEAHVGSLRRQVDMPRMKVSEAARRYGRLAVATVQIVVSTVHFNCARIEG